MGSRTSRHLVPFHGEGTGEGELTWGQQGIWLTMARTGRTMNIGGVTPVEAGTTLGELENVLGSLVGRHQTLRTRLRLVPGGLPRQVVAASGEVPFDVVDIDPGDDADAAAEALRGHYEFTPFDHEHEWPVRMGVVRRGGTLVHLVVQYSHLAVDGFGIEVLIRDLPHLGDPAAPVAGLRPLALAAQQRSPAGLRQSAKSLRYWAGRLRGIPAERFGARLPGQRPRFRELVCRSPALHLALQVVAARTRVGTGHVLLAAYAVAMARVTGRSPSVAQVLVSNRFRAGCAECAGHLTQPSICVLDVADCRFDEVVARAWKEATTAYLHGYYDTLAHQELLDAVARERGGPVDISCFVNDRRGQESMSTPGTGAPPPTPAAVRAALPRTTVRWDRALDTYDGTFYLQVDQGPDAVDLAIWADTQRLAPQDIERCARELESAAVEAALDPTASTGVHAHTARSTADSTGSSI